MMPMFSYAALDRTGREFSGTLEAASVADATEQLVQRGLLPVRTTAVGATSTSTSAAHPDRGPDGAEMATFARQLATLVSAAVPLDQALRLVAAQNPKSAIGAFSARTADSVASGQSLSKAVSEHAPRLPAFLPALITAGEARGRLAPALTDLAQILERRQSIKQKVRSALLYPSVLIGVALVAIAIVLGVLVPTLLPLFQDAARPAPLVLQGADALTRFVVATWPILLCLLVLCVVFARALLRREPVRQALDALVLRLPVVGPLIADTTLSLVARTLGTLLTNGVPLVDALRVTTSVAGNRRYRAALMDAVQRVQEGTPLSRALQRDGVFPDLACRFIAIGEDASRPEVMLLHLADATDAQAARQLDRALGLLSPLLTIVIGAMIGGLILSVMQAILSVNDLAAR